MAVEYDVFLSHSGEHTPAAEELARRLKKEGLRPWLDVGDLVPGKGWLLELEKALRKCASCAVLVGPGGLGKWQEEEMCLAINLRVQTGGSFRVVAVLLPGTDASVKETLPHLLKATTWVEFKNGILDDPEALHRLACGVRGERPEQGPGPEVAEGDCPYRGLEAFDAQHARFFFGREEWVKRLLERLRPLAQRLLAIVGPSGSGKSSLALAGLVPALQRGALAGSAGWPVLVFRPGPNPLESLATALVRGFGTGLAEFKKLIDELGSDPKTLHQFALLALPAGGAEPPRLVVLVDQFEEVFTLCGSEAWRQAFIANLVAAAREPGGRVLVVVTVRADFFGRCAHYPELAEALSSDPQALVGPLTPQELRLAIEKPAHMVGCELEPGLVETLVHAVAGQPGALPLLQYTLLELWQRREAGRLTKRAYEAIGGVHRALEKRADQVLDSLTEPERELCRRIFLRLTLPGEGAEDTKRRAVFPELLVGGAQAQAVEQVVTRLADARLITTEGGQQHPEERYVEVAHEALIGHWGRLRAWIEADRDFLRTRLRIAEAAARWRHEGRLADLLLHEGRPLAEARDLLVERRADLEADVVEFVEASLKHWRRQRQRRKGLIAAVATVFAVLLAVGGYLGYQARLRAARDAGQRLAAANGRVDALGTAEVLAVPGIIKDLGADRRLVQKRLAQMASHGNDPRRRLAAGLALLPDDPTQTRFLAERLVQPEASPEEVLVIRDALAAPGGSTVALEARWRKTLAGKPAALTDAQLRVAGALAKMSPRDPLWPALAEPIARKLVHENPLLLGAWREVFLPIAGRLAEPLRKIYANLAEAEPRDRAYTLLYEFATRPKNASEADDLAALVGDADVDRFAQVLRRLESGRNRGRAIAWLTPKVEKPARFDDDLARRQGRWAMALLRLKRAELVWPLFEHRDDPSLRTELVHNLARFGFDAALPMERLASEADVSARRALILCLGEFAIESVPEAPRRALADRLLAQYRSEPDPGIHAAIDWLLRQKWGRAKDLEASDKELAGRELPKDRDWFVNSQGQTFAVLRGEPGKAMEFQMGSTPQSDPDRSTVETLHRRRIARPFAIAAREVTVRDYARFLEEKPEGVTDWRDNDQFKQAIPTPDSAIGIVTWWEAAKYCNRLSQKEGIPESQWCFPKKIEPGMKLPADYLERGGYRLPTEAEWEYACRAGAVSSRYYGRAEGWLAEYGWYLANSGRTMHAPGGKKPNDFGLFDALGNAYEWCVDPYRARYPTAEGSTPLMDAVVDAVFAEDVIRVLRGGAWDTSPAFLRSALRYGSQPGYLFTNVGFRPVRTYH